MKNSILPLMVVLVIAAVVAWLIRPRPDIGRDGPQVFPGYFVQSSKAHHQLASMPVRAEWTLSASAPLAGADAWRIAIIAAEDREAPTRALMVGLAERLFARGIGALMDPKRQPHDPAVAPLPVPMQARIGITTIAQDPLATPERTVRLAWRVEVMPVSPAAPHPAHRLLGAGQVPAMTATLAVAVTGVPGDWIAWWAAVGRGGAERLLPPPSPSPRPDLNRWDSVLPEPPSNDDIRWHGAFSDELVRGWTGRIGSPLSFDSKQRPIASIDRLRHLVDTAVSQRGKWTAATGPAAMADGRHRWECVSFDPPASLTATPRPDGGWELVWWQERPGPARIFVQWLDAAKAGDAAARARVQAHLETSGIPADLREQARRELPP